MWNEQKGRVCVFVCLRHFKQPPKTLSTHGFPSCSKSQQIRSVGRFRNAGRILLQNLIHFSGTSPHLQQAHEDMKQTGQQLGLTLG